METRNLPWEAKSTLFSPAKQKLKGDIIFPCIEELNSKEAKNAQKQLVV